MTPGQLITLAHQHRAAHQTSGQAPSQSGPGLMALAAM